MVNKEEKMKKRLMSVIKYIIIYAGIVLVLVTLLVITAKIPKELIIENMKKFTQDFYYSPNMMQEFYSEKIEKENTYRHMYSDSTALDIMYYIDSEHPLKSVMENNYYSPDGDLEIPYDYIELERNDYQANAKYLRYWFGEMIIMRPLLVFMDMQHIYNINAIIMLVALSTLLIMLWKRQNKALVVVIIISSIICKLYIVPYCFEYYWSFLIAIIVSIIAIKINEKNKKTNILFMIAGMLTCFFDLLSTETVTLLLPMLLLLQINYQNKKIYNLKQGITFIIQSICLWLIGYCGMWMTKWILASIVLKINAFDYVTDYLLNRLNGSGNKNMEILKDINYLPLKSIIRNIDQLLIIDILEKKRYFMGINYWYYNIGNNFYRQKEFKKIMDFSYIFIDCNYSIYSLYSDSKSFIYTLCIYI